MKNDPLMKVLLVMLFSLFCSFGMAEEIANVTLDRAWGLLLGDEVTVQVGLLDAGEGLDESSLPQIDKRYGTWLYLKAIDFDHQQLFLTYQIVNVPTENTLITTPELNIRRLSDDWIVIPAMPLTIGPLLPADNDEESANIVAKPDYAPILISTIANEQKLKLFSGLTLFSILVLVMWHFGWKPKNRQPFSQAIHELSRLKWQRSIPANQASRILHAAFNRTADTIVVHSELEQVLEQVSWLKPLKDEIDIFYQRSANHFFTRQAEQEPDFDSIKKLARACRAREKMI